MGLPLVNLEFDREFLGEAFLKIYNKIFRHLKFSNIYLVPHLIFISRLIISSIYHIYYIIFLCFSLSKRICIYLLRRPFNIIQSNISPFVLLHERLKPN